MPKLRFPHLAPLLLLLLALPALGDAPTLSVDVGTAAEAQGPPMLVAPLPAGQSWQAPWAEVTVEVYLNGRLSQTRIVEAERRTDEARVELLAYQPEDRERLLSLAQRDGYDVEARVLIDGVESYRGSIQELSATENRQAPTVPFASLRPVAGTAVTGTAPQFIAAASCPARTACYDDCYDDREQCIQSTCAGEPWEADPVDECEPCEYDYNQCIDTCNSTITCPCVNPKRVYTTTQTHLVNILNYGLRCYEDPWQYDFVDGSLYQEVVYTYRRDTIRVTEYCNGSSSSVVTGSVYFSDNCLEDSFLSCYYPSLKAWFGCR